MRFFQPQTKIPGPQAHQRTNPNKLQDPQITAGFAGENYSLHEITEEIAKFLKSPVRPQAQGE